MQNVAPHHIHTFPSIFQYKSFEKLKKLGVLILQPVIHVAPPGGKPNTGTTHFFGRNLIHTNTPFMLQSFRKIVDEISSVGNLLNSNKKTSSTSSTYFIKHNDLSFRLCSRELRSWCIDNEGDGLW